MTTAPGSILLMGVSGSGKTTLGQALARKLGWHFSDADAFHPAGNIAKMHAGQPLNDADRAPWLASLQHHLAHSLAEARPTVLACSALKKRYRQQLLSKLPPHAVRLVYLRGSRELLATRLAARRGHFIPAALLDSQLASLEEPNIDENALVLDIARSPSELVGQIVKTLALQVARPVASSTPMPPPTSLPIQTACHWQDYRLLDCADGMKREQWGPYTLVRPDPQIIWQRQGNSKGCADHAIYHRSDKGGGHWEFRQRLPESWTLSYAPLGLRFKIRPTNFKHTGLFPEQAVNWEWATALIKNALAKAGAGPRPRVLNLFAYTGAATCAAAKAGAEVTHVDAAEGMVKWARENAALSDLCAAPIRYLCDDCLKFVRRENRRGRRYDAIIMDPPSYGRGSGGQMWKLETHLWPLLQECHALLSDSPLFFLINAYTAQLSPTVLANLLSELFTGAPHCAISAGELGLPIEADAKILPCGIFGRAQWTRTKE